MIETKNRNLVFFSMLQFTIVRNLIPSVFTKHLDFIQHQAHYKAHVQGSEILISPL